MSTALSNIRVFVHFKESTVFAGDEIECTITYKNVEVPKVAKRAASLAAQPRVGAAAVRRASQGAASPPSTPLRPTPSRQTSSSSLKEIASRPSPGNRPILALNVMDGVGRDYEQMQSPRALNVAEAINASKNDRKVSIISLGKQPGNANIRRTSQMGSPRTPTFRHRRSISAQNLAGSPDILSPSMMGARPMLSRSPLSGTLPAPFVGEPDFLSSVAESPSRRLPQAPPKLLRVHSAGPSPRSPLRSEAPVGMQYERNRKKKVPVLAPLTVRKRPSHVKASNDDTPPLSPLDHAPSIASPDHTPRSSIDVFTSINGSNDTLAAEHTPRVLSTNSHKSPFLRPLPSQASEPTGNKTETLMMGFAHISGSFTVDGSLVNEGEFEEVKRKAVIGGQGGGGVVGVERNRQSGGIFGGIGWGSLTQSFGGLMGGSELSTIKEMKDIADSKSIPLITTPKSILFVDLQLAPGESRSYRFSFTLPRGLPPTHRGRAMKVTYRLVIGTQRPASVNGRQQQPIKSVEVPFRVFGGVNVLGEVLGHNLMSPYIILRDQARTSALDDSSTPTPSKSNRRPVPRRRASQYAAGLSEFQSYVNCLLENPRKNSSVGLLSPTMDNDNRRSSYMDSNASGHRASSTRELIDLAIRRSAFLYGSDQSPTNFTIARASQLIAHINLTRPAFKLGEVVSCVVDFTSAQTLCYGLEMTLESSEKVDPSFAIRSTQSVERATRRSWARTIESALWSKRCVFNAQIPSTATPTFSTTGIGLDWCIRVEFIVAKQWAQDDDNGDANMDDEARRKVERLLEEINSDERGVTQSAASYLACESFEVTVPIKVFGAAVGDGENGTEADGLAV